MRARMDACTHPFFSHLGITYLYACMHVYVFFWDWERSSESTTEGSTHRWHRPQAEASAVRSKLIQALVAAGETAKSYIAALGVQNNLELRPRGGEADVSFLSRVQTGSQALLTVVTPKLVKCVEFGNFWTR